jgi:hypothetical protein
MFSFASLLRERLHQNRRELDNISRDLLEVHLQVASAVSKEDWSLLDKLTYQKATQVGEESKATQIRKFNHLYKTQPTPHHTYSNEYGYQPQSTDAG